MRKSSKGKVKRSFCLDTVLDKNGCDITMKNSKGLYVSNDPASAARKATTQICRKKGLTGECELYLVLKETTRNSKGSNYSYNVKREKSKTEGPFGNEFVNVSKSMKNKKMPECKKTKKNNKK